jgi:hypothetical protein
VPRASSPLRRRLNSIKSFLIGFWMTFFPMFDVPGARLAAQLPPEPARLQARPPLPLARSRAAHRRDAVFWPILLMYWVRPARASRRRETQLPQPHALSIRFPHAR